MPLRRWAVLGLLAVLVVILIAGAARLELRRLAPKPHEGLAKAGTPWLAPLAHWDQESPRQPYSIQRVSDPALQGEDSLRFELRRGDTWANRASLTSRAELETDDRAAMDSVRWYRFALMLPPDFPIENNRLVLFQWHGSDKKYLGESPRSPVLAFRFVNGDFYVSMRHSAERIVMDPDHVPAETLFKTRDFPLGRWNDFVIQARWDYTAGGFVNIWWNGRPVVRYRGPVGYNDDAGPYVQFGLYRDASDRTYVSYLNQVRAGATAAEVGFALP